MDNTQMTNCNYCGTPLVNGVCPNCHPEMFAQQPAYVQPEQQAYAQPVQQAYAQSEQQAYAQPEQQGYAQPEQQIYAQPEQSAYGQGNPSQVYGEPVTFVPYCETPIGQELQQAAEEFGFFIEKGEKIQCVYSGEDLKCYENNLDYYIIKHRIHRKGFVVVTEKNAYFGGKMSHIIPNQPVTKEKSVRPVKLTDISEIGVSGKFLDKTKTKNKMRQYVITSAICGVWGIFGFILPVALPLFSLLLLILAALIHMPMPRFFFIPLDLVSKIKFSSPVLEILFVLFCLGGAVAMVISFANFKNIKKCNAKVFFNINHRSGTLELKSYMFRTTVEPIENFMAQFSQCLDDARIAEISERIQREKEECLAEERRIEAERIAEEQRKAEEARLAEEARIAEEERIAKEAAAMQSAMEKAMQNVSAAPTGGTSNIAEELKTYGEMYKQGLISEEEFAAFKAKLLSK